MVAIIDDREDVWDATPNLVHVKPYVFFAGTADINAPPTLNKSTPSQDLVKRVGGVNKNENNNNNNGNGEEGGGGTVTMATVAMETPKQEEMMVMRTVKEGTVTTATATTEMVTMETMTSRSKL